MERVLDRCEGRADLTRPDVADMVIEAISFRERTGKWSMLAYVLMPNHLHLFFRLVDGRLTKTMIGFKRWTGREAADLLDRSGERFWQREWFDHWSRSALQDERIVEYIRQNPVKAGLVDDYRNWPYGSWNA
jgi:REP element-mobilizing transposase RayT